jgi:hypothetical protein
LKPLPSFSVAAAAVVSCALLYLCVCAYALKKQAAWNHCVMEESSEKGLGVTLPMRTASFSIDSLHS